MIEPLRYNAEKYPPYEIMRPVFCHACLQNKATKDDPGVAIKFCPKCPTTSGADKTYGSFHCADCDDSIHKLGAMRKHMRYIVVVGPGVRKRVTVRGDGKSFPYSLDQVHIRLSSKVYHNGKRVAIIQPKEISFTTGMSGKCLHVQILGARNLMVGDTNGTSDPFIVYSFCGKVLGQTRVRPRSTNPRWDNETFTIPMDPNFPAPRELLQSQKDMVRLEVYDHDALSSSEFLGHVELTRSKLMKIAMISNEAPIRLPLTMKEYHGFVNVELGHCPSFLHVRAVKGENLNKINHSNLSNPYVKVYLGNNLLLGTTPVINKSINPQWETGNVFKIKILQMLFAERFAISQVDTYNETQALNAHMRGETHQRYDQDADEKVFSEFNQLPTNLALLRIEIWHKTGRFSSDVLMGQAYISVYKFRKMLPSFPHTDVDSMSKYSAYVSKTVDIDTKSMKMKMAKREPMKGCLSRLGGCLCRPCRSSYKKVDPPVQAKRRGLLGAIPQSMHRHGGDNAVSFDEDGAMVHPGRGRVKHASSMLPSEEQTYDSFRGAPESPLVGFPDDLDGFQRSRRGGPPPPPLTIDTGGGVRLGAQFDQLSRDSFQSGSSGDAGAGGQTGDQIGLNLEGGGTGHGQDSFSTEQEGEEEGGEEQGYGEAVDPEDTLGDEEEEEEEERGDEEEEEDEGGGLSGSGTGTGVFLTSGADKSSSSFKRDSSFRSTLSRGLSVRQDITWSDSYPFPVMIDSTSNLGVDQYGNAYSQGFVVLRLITAPRGNVLLGLDQAVRQMTVGESATVKCRWDYAYGSYSMGEQFPPRANVIFKVKLLEVNGKGRYQVCSRAIARLYRAAKSPCACVFRGRKKPLLEGSQKVKKKSLCNRLLSMCGLGAKEELSDSEDEEEQEESEEEGLLESVEDPYDFSSSTASDTFQSRPKVKVDPYMRKHLNKSVKSGAQLLWNYKPPVVVKKKKVRPQLPSEKIMGMGALEEEDGVEQDEEGQLIEDAFDQGV